ncbi:MULTISPECIES: hypothetical protein [unclassified Alteromonas]|uniref:hypothetical protein n=1 Tax=unclassified Alteromonas TaxID=2614992 RepID=UPI0013758C13|nr:MULTISPECIES: hypothetical protein [unclassified Alteromonas]MDO6475829.1 hypothetical protein [Alteromonas sp. 1_MG-2023]MEC7689732.1 hypothetical protein [Pseudomonadota bacterium]|tara:strand:- start:18 stop:185 length:168 start_codon:yes stop_codon:yes gene_type:complete
MDDSLSGLQGKLLDTSEKLENFIPTSEHASSLKEDLHDLLSMLSALQSRSANAGQ